ncbi:MFS transporter [Lactococcus hircilactis]|uniref:MFS transporter n=1 Tax=Lactococcus hircilactis TaxID=1494462 RepID=A0A7X1Z6S5_9LACT|nr:MFS transporter [Lactococcus hircilactis]MQW38711.1 MFS transporter [Lactococcus hircilactis]
MKKYFIKNKLLMIFLMFLFGNLASGTLTFMISWTVLKETHQASQFALLSTVSSLAMLIAMPLIGIIVDRYNHKRLLLIAQVFSVFILLSFILQPFHGLIVYILFSIGLNLGDLLFSITMYASVKSLSDNKTEMSKINGIEQGIGALFAIISPAVAGFVFTFISVRAFSWIEIVCEALVVLLVFQLNFERFDTTIEEKENTGVERTSYKKVLKILNKKYVVMIIVSIMIVLNFLLGSINVGIPFILNKNYQGNTVILGIVQLSFPLGIVLSSLLVQKLPKFQLFKLLKISYFSCAFAIFSFGIVISFLMKQMIFTVVILSILMLFMGLGLGFSRVPMMTFAQNNIPENIQGRAFSIIDTSAQILSPLGLMFYGVLFDNFSGNWIYLFSSFLMFGVLLVGFYFVDRADKKDYIY